MMTDSAEKKPSVRRRRRAGKSGKGGMPRIMWLALLVCVAGAVALFRSGGSDHMPTGLGENRTVVTAPDLESEPVSGDVEIAAEGLQLTPETPVAGADLGQADNAPLEIEVTRPLPEAGTVDTEAPPATTGAAAPAEIEASPATQTLPADVKPEPARKAPPAPRLAQQPQGPYLVQAGSFGDTENAQKEADRLKKAGWEAAVRVGNKAGGGLIYRVQIGYFATREDAQAFIDQNSRKLPGAIPAHR
jgi:cell division septation protein DedD